MNKVVKIELKIDQYDKDGNKVDYKEINQLLWELQKQTRVIKNKTIQQCWEYSLKKRAYKEKYGKNPSVNEILGCSLSSYIERQLKNESNLYSGNYSSMIKDVSGRYKKAENDIFMGKKSIITYKENQPLELKNSSIILKNGFIFLNMVKSEIRDKYHFKDTKIRFKAVGYDKATYDKSTRTILERCECNEYDIAASKLVYRKSKWFLYLGYEFEPQVIDNLDPDKILGVDLGVALPICASVYGDLDRFTINGGEIEEFRRRVESRKLSMLKQGRYCGDGRIGHGIKTRNKSVYAIEDKIARFRDTTNHKYSRALIDYAVKNGCGTIQMEELKGITIDANRFLKNWTYFDLQTKIEHKAKEKGINVIYIKPRYTSKRCSKCGYIDPNNRIDQAHFVCKKCGFKENADYNASQNIGISQIDKIIENEMKTGCETEAR